MTPTKPSFALPPMAPLQSVPKRPIAIWLLLLLSGALAVFFGAMVVKHLFSAIGALDLSDLSRSLVNALILVFIAGYLGLASIAMYRRRRVARLLGTFFLVLLALAAVFGPSEPSARIVASSDAMAGWWAARLSLGTVILLWAYLAGWSATARAYYGASVRSPVESPRSEA